MPSELSEQREVVRILDRSGVLCFAVPNGGFRLDLEAALLVQSGVKAGVPDLVVLPAPRTSLSAVPLGRGKRSALPPPPLSLGLRIGCEMKRADWRVPRPGRSKARRKFEQQVAMHERLRELGWYCFFAPGADAALGEMVRLGVELVSSALPGPEPEWAEPGALVAWGRSKERLEGGSTRGGV